MFIVHQDFVYTCRYRDFHFLQQKLKYIGAQFTWTSFKKAFDKHLCGKKDEQ